ncbi:ABC transporter, transmembrane region:ABC transporter:Peptidase C39, bacteriocin processing [Rhodovulum sp. P5]|uniref:ABC transporter transmembrane domain-containing protein n=1 Tax=Rhodovulum sp. P5 TaxID=1564506 RepID=UPI0009C24536|nr:ABC transporter transmembrane domain-containing protein [Rhodovulum sp. P5]ARE40534.1 ABC transporter, transmembrane region:ABC transporter:Peptidase C39, bacteriocin processing [Rhodovulum sp. P5]
MVDRIRSIKPRLGADVLVASMVTNIFALALPLVILHVFDRVIPNAGAATLSVLVASLVVVALLDYRLRLARGHSVLVRAFRKEVEVHGAALARVLGPGVDRGFLARGDLLDHFMSIGRVRKHHSSDVAMALLDIPFIVLFIAVMALISPVMGVGATVLSILSAVIVWAFRTRILKLTNERQERDRRRHAFLIESLTGIETIKSLGIEPAMVRRYERFIGGSVGITRDLNGLTSFTQGLTGTISLIAPVVMAGLGALMVVRGDMTMGGLAAGVLLTGRIIQPTLRMEALLAGGRDLRPAIKEVEGLLAAPAAIEGQTRLEQIESVTLEDVGIAGPSPGQCCLENISLTLKRGDTISLVGPEGSGRSRFLSVLAGQQRPAKGQILINDRPMDSYDPRDIAHRVSLLSSEYHFFEGTLLDNMTGFRSEEFGAQAVQLARILGLHDFIMRHPDGYGLNVSKQTESALPQSVRAAAVMISGLVTKPDLILFDEANHGFDVYTDAALRGLFEALRPGTLQVLVTYKPSLLSLASRHFRVHQTRVLETGVERAFDFGGGE